MSQSIVIEYINFSGEPAVILFTPFGETDVINLGNVILPYDFNPSLLNYYSDLEGPPVIVRVQTINGINQITSIWQCTG